MKKKPADKRYRDRHITFPPDLDDAIAERAKREDRDYTFIVRRLVRQGLDAEKAA